jgi:hypothetical protein
MDIWEIVVGPLNIYDYWDSWWLGCDWVMINESVQVVYR